MPFHAADMVGRLAPAAAPKARLALEAVLALALGIAVARLAWVALTPQGPFGTPRAAPRTAAAPAADLSILTRFDPFSRAAPAAQASSGAGLRLFGVRSGAGGGAAIIAGPDGRQQVFAVGEEIAPGVTLQAIAADHVVLKTPAGSSVLAFPPSTATAPVQMPAPVAAPPAPAPPPPPAEQPAVQPGAEAAPSATPAP